MYAYTPLRSDDLCDDLLYCRSISIIEQILADFYLGSGYRPQKSTRPSGRAIAPLLDIPPHARSGSIFFTCSALARNLGLLAELPEKLNSEVSTWLPAGCSVTRAWDCCYVALG